MSLSKFRRSLSDHAIDYRDHSISLVDGNVSIDGVIVLEEYDDINSAYAYAKSYVDSLIVIESDTTEILEEKIASVITKYHSVKVTNTLIEAYAELISSDEFSLDPVVLELKEGRSTLNKTTFTLLDGSIVALDESTLKTLMSLSVDKYKLVDYMKASKDNFFSVIEKIRE